MFWLGLAFSTLGLAASAQEAKQANAVPTAMDKALEQSKISGLPILAVGGRET
jgi:hypothetical protein